MEADNEIETGVICLKPEDAMRAKRRRSVVVDRGISFEHLEPRSLFSVPGGSDPWLIQGTPGDDEIIVSVDPADSSRLVVKIGGEVKFACVDGPDFDGHQVDFDDLMTRLRRFAEQEKTAVERWSESCRMNNPVQPLKKPERRVSQEAELPDPFDEVRGG